jgi:hypothetical protein
MHRQNAAYAISKSRLYGWLMPAYSDPNSSLLHQHLPHRDPRELTEAAGRLGWASWEDFPTIVPGACPWLAPTPSAGEHDQPRSQRDPSRFHRVK